MTDPLGETERLTAWWVGLTADHRDEARSLDGGDPMPRWMLASLTRAGIPQSAAWWPSVEDGPTFTVPDRVVIFVGDQ